MLTLYKVRTREVSFIFYLHVSCMKTTQMNSNIKTQVQVDIHIHEILNAQSSYRLFTERNLEVILLSHFDTN